MEQQPSDDGMIAFLKMYSTMPNAYIDDLFSLYDPDTAQTDFAVNLDAVAKWLGVYKANLMMTLRSAYKAGFDYQISKAPRPVPPGHVADALARRSGNAYKHVLLTPDCFKRLCMRSRGKKAEQVRTYFIQVEQLVMRYRTQMLAGMREEVARLERNQRARDPGDHAGYIYVIQASPERDSVFKIGRTKDLARRLTEYQTGRADDLEVVFKFRTDRLQQTEACLKALLKTRQYRKFREVYQVDLDTIKELVAGCDALSDRADARPRLKIEHAAPKAPQLGGGFYAILQRAQRNDALHYA